LNRTCDGIRPNYTFDESCQGTVPEAIIAFLESESFEDAIRLAISLGGDSDTLACITGGIAEAFYKYQMPYMIKKEVRKLLDADLWKIVKEFRSKQKRHFVHPRWSDCNIRIIHQASEEERKEAIEKMCDNLINNIKKL